MYSTEIWTHCDLLVKGYFKVSSAIWCEITCFVDMDSCHFDYERRFISITSFAAATLRMPQPLAVCFEMDNVEWLSCC